MKLHLGTYQDKAEKAYMDLEIVMRSNLLLQAASGGGKSWALRRLVEQAAKHVPVGIIDPEGEFASLREKYPFVLIGPGGETPADPRSAATVARRMLELGTSFVADIYELRPAQRHEWVRNFIDALVDAPKRLWRDLLVCLDEAHIYAPEGGHGRDKKTSVALNSVADLASRGRKRGYGLVCATQRLGKLNKDVAAELKNQVIGMAVLDVDRERAAEALGKKRDRRTKLDFFDEIKLMSPGVFFAQGRALTYDVRCIRFGGVITTHPEPGKSAKMGAPPPMSKIKKLLPQLADLPQEAEKEAKTVEELKVEVQRLKGELAHALDEAPAPEIQTKVEVVEAVPQWMVDELGALRGHVQDLRSALEVVDRMDTTIAQVHGQAEAAVPDGVVTQSRVQRANAQLEAEATALRTSAGTGAQRSFVSKSAPNGSNGAIPRVSLSSEAAPMRMLKALAMHHRGRMSKRACATMAGIKSSTGSFRTYLTTMRTNGWIETQGQDMVLLPGGRKAAGNVPRMRTRAQLFEAWTPNIGKTPTEILRVVLRLGQCEYPRIAREVNAARVDGDTISHTTGSFRTYITTLVSNGLVDRAGPGVIKPSEVWSQVK